MMPVVPRAAQQALRLSCDEADGEMGPEIADQPSLLGQLGRKVDGTHDAEIALGARAQGRPFHGYSSWRASATCCAPTTVFLARAARSSAVSASPSAARRLPREIS
jgi:hypothetical protein